MRIWNDPQDSIREHPSACSDKTGMPACSRDNSGCAVQLQTLLTCFLPKFCRGGAGKLQAAGDVVEHT